MTTAAAEPLHIVCVLPFNQHGKKYRVGEQVLRADYAKWAKGTLDRRIANRFIEIMPQSLMALLLDDEGDEGDGGLGGDAGGKALPPKEVPDGLKKKSEFIPWLISVAPDIAKEIDVRPQSDAVRAAVNAALAKVHEDAALAKAAAGTQGAGA